MIDLDKTRVPRHIAIIMDGNGRWAEKRGRQRTYGHQAGVEAVRAVASECVRLGVKWLTLYTFSTENWNRPSEEVAALMTIILKSMEEEIFMKNNVRFRVVGDRSRLPDDVNGKLTEMGGLTQANSAMTMVVALSYSSRWELTKAARDIAREVEKGTLAVNDINEDTVSQHLETRFMPDPDLLIRTGGELRVSNFLLWQIAYSELYFSDTYWPDFNEEELHKAIESYQHRQRRFGMIEEQVKKQNKTL